MYIQILCKGRPYLLIAAGYRVFSASATVLSLYHINDQHNANHKEIFAMTTSLLHKLQRS
jgi:hypothetical protein